MRLVYTIPAVSNEAQGPSYSVPRLARALADLGHEVDLMSVGEEAFVVRKEYRHSGYRHDFAHVPLLRSLVFSRGFRDELRTRAKTHDLIHNHSIWLMPNVYPAWAARAADKPLVVSPRGTFSPVALAISSLKKKAFWVLAQGPAVRQATLLHATSEDEYRDIRARGLKQPVAVVPNGVDIPAARPHLREGANRRTLLYLGRLHPIKGIENLIKAWTRVAPRHGDWDLRLVGPGDAAYVASLKALAETLGAPNITFAEPCYGEAKNDEYAAAELYILPSFSENFGMSVAEALANGTPAIVTHGTPWSGVRERNCGWWVPADEAGIEAALDEAMALDRARLSQMGASARAWMQESYSWNGIARQMDEVYRWILHGGATPASVRVD